MAIILVILYAFYFILIGITGNANQFLTDVQQEKTFLYWVLVLLVISALWQSNVAAPFAKAFAALVVIGFLLANKNGLTILNNAAQILPALGGSSGSSTPAGATGAAGGLT